mgnify:CR=1 FL=1
MSGHQFADAFGLLADIAQKSRSCAFALPDSKPPQQSWTGIGFSLGETILLASMEDIAEIINLPRCTRIPKAKSFVRGAASVRGSIVPVVDLLAFFSLRTNRAARLQRMLVVEFGESYSGLVVDDILGMQHFPLENFEESYPYDLQDCFVPFVCGSYWRTTSDGSEEYWPVLDLHQLLADQSLINLSL